MAGLPVPSLHYHSADSVGSSFFGSLSPWKSQTRAHQVIIIITIRMQKKLKVKSKGEKRSGAKVTGKAAEAVKIRNFIHLHFRALFQEQHTWEI